MRQSAGDFLNSASPYSAYGLRPTENSYEGSLPTTSHSANDMGGNPFHPDSPFFWVIAFVGLTLVGIVGVTAGGRVGPAKAEIKLGDM